MSVMSCVIEKNLPVPAMQFSSSELKLQRSKIDILIRAKADWDLMVVVAIAVFKILFACLFMKNTWSSWFERMMMPQSIFSRMHGLDFGLLFWVSDALNKSFWLTFWSLEATRIDKRNVKRPANSTIAEQIATESESLRRSKASPNWHK